MSAKLRILALVHEHLVPPEALPDGVDPVAAEWRTEWDVVSTLRALGHEVQPLGVHDDLGDIRRMFQDWKPHIAFNLLEAFNDVTIFDQNVVSHLELLKLPYTGCNPRGLLLARDKSLSKKLLAYHHLIVPRFAVFPRGRRIHRPKGLEFPLIVKSLVHEASLGISQASIVDSDEKLRERVAFSAVAVTIEPGSASAGNDGSGGGWTLGDALDDALGVLRALAGATLVALAVLVPAGLLAAAAWPAYRLWLRRRRERALEM